MGELALKVRYHGRKELDASRREIFFKMGYIGLGAGLVAWILSAFGLKYFFIIGIVFFIPGLFHVVYGKIGKELFMETNYISIHDGKIQYKNSFRRSRTIRIADIKDINLDTSFVEFIMHDRKIKWYDFAVFRHTESGRIMEALATIKASLDKKDLQLQ